MSYIFLILDGVCTICGPQQCHTTQKVNLHQYSSYTINTRDIHIYFTNMYVFILLKV